MNAIDIEKIVFAQLSSFGFKHHSAGFRYLCTGLQLALEQPSILNEMTERFYPAVAAVHDSTSSAVESSMRRAILDAYEHGNRKKQFQKIFLRYTHECPTVSEFMTGNVHKLLYGDL